MSELLQGIASLTKTVQQTLNSYEVRKLGDKVQGYVMNFTETEQKVREATNEDPWGPTGPEMQEIASLTFQYDQFTEVMGMLWKRLLQDNKMAWRRVYKSLILLNYLLKNGSERVIATARDHSFEMRSLESYKCVDERGKDEGVNVRHRVKLILELLNDDELLRNERRKAKADGREKYQGFSKDDMLYRGGSSSTTNSSKFDSFERWNDKNHGKDEQEEKQKDWKSVTTRSGSSTRREVTAFDFDTGDNSRSRASGSPELGIRERTPEPLDEGEDEEFGDFTSARASVVVPTNGQTIQLKNVSLNKPIDLAAISKPSSGGGDFDLLGLDLIGDASKTNIGNFDPFQSKNESNNIIFIERPKSQQQTSIIPSQNLNFVQSTPSIPSAAPELLDIFSSPPIQPQTTQNQFLPANIQKTNQIGDLLNSVQLPHQQQQNIISSTCLSSSAHQPTTTNKNVQNQPKLPKTWEDFKGKVNIDFDNLSLKSPIKPTPTLNDLKKSASGGQNISSQGSHCLCTTDEIITARSGKTIQITNTDAEGRMAMADALAQMKELALNARNPHLLTIATLTGHVVLSYGHCTAAMDNGPAKAVNYAEQLRQTGDQFGQPVEVSRLYNEDFAFHSSEIQTADLKQSDTGPSVQTRRGHQGPAAFLICASGLSEYGLDSAHPIKYTHLDIGDSMNAYPKTSLPSPLLTLIAHHILHKTKF